MVPDALAAEHGALDTDTTNDDVDASRPAPGMRGNHGPRVDIPLSESETSKEPFREGERER